MMRKSKIFPKIFLITFTNLISLTLIIHLAVFFIFEKTYLNNAQEDLNQRANQISKSLDRRDLDFVKNNISLYSMSNDIKVMIEDDKKDKKIDLNEDIKPDYTSNSNSLIIETRKVNLTNNKSINLQFIYLTDMRKKAINISLKFLPISLLISLMFSTVLSIIAARVLSRHIKNTKKTIDRMMILDKDARLKVYSDDELAGVFKDINNLYERFLSLMDEINQKNEKILTLKTQKLDFLRSSSHELKTPLASLSIILENMKYKIGKYKDRDTYIEKCLGLTNTLASNISQILRVSAIDDMPIQSDYFIIKEEIKKILANYMIIIKEKNIEVSILLENEKMYMDRPAFNLVISNLLSNAAKYSKDKGEINIGIAYKYLYIENTYEGDLDIKDAFNIKNDLEKEGSNGLGLYLVKSLLEKSKKNFKLEKNKDYVRFSIAL